MNDNYPKTFTWKEKRRWGKWKKCNKIVNNVYELKLAMDALVAMGTENAKFTGMVN